MKTHLLLLALTVSTILPAACYGQGEAVAPDAILPPDADATPRIRFDKLTEQELSQAQKDPSFLLNRLLEEADRRKVDAKVKEYLVVSNKAYMRKIRSYLKLVKDPTEPTRIRDLFLKELKALEQSPYLAKLSDEETSFGQLLVSGEVLQVIDESNLLAKVRLIGSEEDNLIWLTGINTTGFVDSAELRLGFFAKRLWTLDGDGTRSYTSSMGTKRTVTCIRPHELTFGEVAAQSDLFKFGHHWTQIYDAIKRAEAQEALFRTWSDSTGAFSVEAKFIEFKDNKLYLERRDDGRRIGLPPYRLSKEDQEWFRNELRRRREEGEVQGREPHRQRQVRVQQAPVQPEQQQKAPLKIAPEVAKESPPRGNTKIPPDAVTFQGHHYFLFLERRKWADADEYCRSLGGYLMQADSDEELRFLAEHFGDIIPKLERPCDPWIGRRQHTMTSRGELGNLERDLGRFFICEWDR